MSTQKNRASRRLKGQKVAEFNLAESVFAPTLPVPKRKTTSAKRALFSPGNSLAPSPATTSSTGTPLVSKGTAENAHVNTPGRSSVSNFRI